MLKNINIKAIIVGIVLAYLMNFVISIVLFSGYKNFITENITPKIFIFILLSLFLQSSVPAYIAAIIAKQKIIIHSIVLGSIFVLINIIDLLFETEPIGFLWTVFFFCGLFLFSIFGGIIRKIEIEYLLKKDIKNCI